MKFKHSFHIPVMGTGYTLTSPLKLAQYGIDSVVSVVDDILLEKLRKRICEKHNQDYQEIKADQPNYRAKRTTAYLNLMNKLVKQNFENLINSIELKGDEIKKYFNLMPNSKQLFKDFENFRSTCSDVNKLKHYLSDKLSIGKIDVNIMTKLDKVNFFKGEELSPEYNDAHASLRGFAESDLESTLVLSAGMNPRLYSYIEQFDDFYPDENGHIKKKIAIKVSDYRSAMIQGKFLAKKGIWVSEYRIESGLNCGGHAFATEGLLLGPILSEFKTKKSDLIESVSEIFESALEQKKAIKLNAKLDVKISAQGGVGTAQEHQFLIDQFNVDSVGWGSPFLLVPEATNVDSETRNKLCKAKEEDLYLSDISPLGVKFNNLKNNSMDIKLQNLADSGKSGSPCPKQFMISNKEFSDKPLCTASKLYQKMKIEELKSLKLPKLELDKAMKKVYEKACLCVGLGSPAMQEYGDKEKTLDGAVSICPGPNIAYYNHQYSLKTMVDSIYGKVKNLASPNRPNMFVKELGMYMDHLSEKFNSSIADKKSIKVLETYIDNMKDGIKYYNVMFETYKQKFNDSYVQTKELLSNYDKELENYMLKINQLKVSLA